MKISAVIFDVDGVLLDTVPYHFSAWEKMFAEEGADFSFQDYVEKVNGLPRLIGIKNILVDITDEEKLNQLAEKKQKYFLELVAANPPQPLKGSREFLKKLKKKKIKLAAASSSKNAPRLLESAGLSQFFEAIVGGADFKLPKPDPDIFLTASKKLRVNPEVSLVIEDAWLGVQAAKNAKMKSVGLMTSQDKKLHALADIVVESLDDHGAILEKFNM